MLPDPRNRPVGFYVHHHGSGHATRCRQLAQTLPQGTPYRFFSSASRFFPEPDLEQLTLIPPDVRPDGPAEEDLLKEQILHYAPTDLPALSRRMADIAGWIADNQPAYFVVDLSVEVAIFARLCGCRVLLVRLHGYRDDPAHLAAFRLADRLLAPFPEVLEDEHTPQWVRAKTDYLGTFSRFDNRRNSSLTEGNEQQTREALGLPDDRPVVTVINGSGGAKRPTDYWADTAQQHPGYHWVLVGELDRGDFNPPPNLHTPGYVSDPYAYLRVANYIIGSGGTNLMSEVAAVRGRFISLPEDRPFGEQLCKMRALEKLGLTVLLEQLPAASGWSAPLQRADKIQLDNWEQLYT